MKNCIFELVNICTFKPYTLYDNNYYKINFNMIVHKNKEEEISNHNIFFPIQIFKEIKSLCDKSNITFSYELHNYKEFKNEIYKFVIFCYKFIWKRLIGL